MPKKKFLLVNYEYPPIGGGGGNATESIANELQNVDTEITVLTSHYKTLPKYEIKNNVKIIRIWTGRKRKDKCSIFEMFLFIIIALIKSVKIAKKIKPNACLIFFSLPTGPIGWWLKRRLGVPYIISLQGGDVPGFMQSELRLYHFLSSFINREIWRSAEYVVANSLGLQKLAKKFMLDVNHVMIPAGVDVKKFTPKIKIEVNTKVKLLFVGRLVNQKGIDVLLDALYKLDSKNLWSLNIVGDGPLKEILNESVFRLKLENNVNFLGWKDRNDLPSIYKENDILILPSRDEGMPNVMLEAMASSLPIIGSRVSGMDQVIINNKNGLLVKPGDSDELHYAIKKLINNKDNIRDMGYASSNLVKIQYTWKISSSSYQQLLNKICKEKNE